MSDEETGRSGISGKELLERAPALLGLLSAGVLLLTVVHEWGYFSVVGFHFQTLLSTSDYLANAILWLPFHLVILAGSMSGAVAAHVVENRKLRRGHRLMPLDLLVALLLGFGCSVALMTMYSTLIGALLLVALFCAICFRVLVVKGKMEPLKVVSSKSGLGFVLPTALLLSFILGVWEGNAEFRSASQVYELRRRDGGGQRHILPLRTLEKGLLAYNVASNKIEFVRWESVEGLSVIRQPSHRLLDVSCAWFYAGCRQPVVPPI